MATKPLLVVAALAVLVAACGARTDTVPECDTAAVEYCQTNGCPLTGPTADSTPALDVWCSGAPSYAPFVTGIGSCKTPTGSVWAIDVETVDATGSTVYLLYDPTSTKLVEVSIVAPGGNGAGAQDYGACGVGVGIISCVSTLVRCP
jgi:hypothetical protein